MPYTGYMTILYRKGSANEADPVSRRPDFYSIWWDGEVPDPLTALHAMEVLGTDSGITVGDEFVAKLKGAYAATNYFNVENGSWQKDNLQHSADGLFLYHGRIVIPRNAPDLRNCLMYELHDAAGHSSWRRMLSTLLRRFWWRGISADCKKHCSNCVECNRSKPLRRGSAPVHPLPVPTIPVGSGRP